MGAARPDDDDEGRGGGGINDDDDDDEGGSARAASALARARRAVASGGPRLVLAAPARVLASDRPRPRGPAEAARAVPALSWASRAC